MNNIFDGFENWCETCEDTFTEDCADEGHKLWLAPSDFCWEICGRCRGEGTLGGYPGVYTADDFYEDPDFAEEYMAYRRGCEDCGGTGKVRTLTEEALARPSIRAWIDDYNDMRATERAERAMGA